MSNIIPVGIRKIVKAGSRYVISIPPKIVAHLLNHGYEYVIVTIEPVKLDDIRGKGASDNAS